MQAAKIVGEFKVIVIGDGGVGKTTFIHRHIAGEPEKKYVANRGYESTSITFYTNLGPIKLTLQDTCGQEKLAGLRDAFYIGAHAAIIMFDVTSRITYKNVPHWYRDVIRICDNIPVVLVGNKIDLKERKVKPRQTIFHRKRNLPYFDISAKANYQYEQPFLSILKALTKDSNLCLLKPLDLKPQETELDPLQIEELAKQWHDANQATMPNEQDEEF